MKARIYALAAAALLVSVTAPASAQTPATTPQRSGFTLLVNLGYGYQNDEFLPEAKSGLAGLNLGIGGFLSSDLALWFRASGTNVSYDSFRQISGVGALAVQYWVTDRLNLEGGVGGGFWDDEDTSETGLGVVVGAGLVIFNSGRHNIQLGVEYAPAFTEPETVHNVGITLGYQLL